MRGAECVPRVLRILEQAVDAQRVHEERDAEPNEEHDEKDRVDSRLAKSNQAIAAEAD